MTYQRLVHEVRGQMPPLSSEDVLRWADETVRLPRSFMASRFAVLKLLAAQTAIAHENAGLHRVAAEREAKIRRLVDSNIIGILIWDIKGRVIDANDAFLRMVGYDREDLSAGRLHRTDLSPAEWRDRDALTIAEVKKTGAVQPFEKEYLRKDGSRVPVLVGLAAFDEPRDQGVGFIVDLSARKHAEAEAREIERRYGEVQAELAHANRIATMGHLSASIGHEVNQPLCGVITNVALASRLLTADPPNVEEALRALARIARDGKRASEVVNRIRALIKKAPPQKDEVDINETILEIVGLVRGETTKHDVSIQMKLGDSLPRIRGDRVQLQQVIVNLMMNAVEAMSAIDGGPKNLTIETARTEAKGVVVAVKDSGPGIEPEDIQCVFDAFHTTKTSGLGMGLSISRSIVEAHGGRLWASANIPHGAVFQFTVPTMSIDKPVSCKGLGP